MMLETQGKTIRPALPRADEWTQVKHVPSFARGVALDTDIWAENRQSLDADQWADTRPDLNDVGMRRAPMSLPMRRREILQLDEEYDLSDVPVFKSYPKSLLPLPPN